MYRKVRNLSPDVVNGLGEEPEVLAEAPSTSHNPEKVGAALVAIAADGNEPEPEFTEWGDFHGLVERPDAVERVADRRAPGGYTLYHALPVHNS